MATIDIASRGPHDLELSLKAARAAAPGPAGDASTLSLPLRVGSRAVLAEVRQVSRRPAVLEAEVSGGARAPRALGEIAGQVSWVVFAEQDLRPFYRQVREHPVMGPLVRRLYGLKATRPASLFDMAVLAVTEQQISLAAARRIRERLMAAFGESVDGHSLHPSPEALAGRSVEDLKACGLSGMKAEYIIGLARQVAEGAVDLDSLKERDDADAREYIISLRGFGPWAAEYILVRGLGREDVVPADDLGIRTQVGRYLGDGSRMSPPEVRRALEPFAPWRGLAAFYITAGHRILEAAGG